MASTMITSKCWGHTTHEYAFHRGPIEVAQFLSNWHFCSLKTRVEWNSVFVRVACEVASVPGRHGHVSCLCPNAFAPVSRLHIPASVCLDVALLSHPPSYVIQEKQFSLCDFGSAGGTFVRLASGVPTPLYPSMMIMLGKHQVCRSCTALYCTG